MNHPADFSRERHFVDIARDVTKPAERNAEGVSVVRVVAIDDPHDDWEIDWLFRVGISGMVAPIRVECDDPCDVWDFDALEACDKCR
jgi:hypothetical protein